MTSTEQTRTTPAPASSARSPLFGMLVGLASLGVLLQGVWAGLFVKGHPWVDVHDVGAMVTTALAFLAAIVALLQLRARRDLVAGSIAFFVLCLVEMGIGYSLDDNPVLRAAHYPIAMLLLGLAVWLPLRSRHRV